MIPDSLFKKLFLFLAILAIGLIVVNNFKHQTNPLKIVTIRSRNLTFQVETRAETLSGVLEEQGFNNPSSPPLIRHGGGGVPPLKVRGGEGELLQGTTVEISRPVNVIISDAGIEKSYTSSAATIDDFLKEQEIALAQTDQVNPPLHTFLGDNLRVKIDRIVTLPVTEQLEIAFQTKFVNDSEAYYGREVIITPGRVGKKDQNFLITYKNGVEIKRKLVSEKILSQPVTEQRSFGTKIEIVETTEGRASWYAYQGCQCAAHPFYEKGRYVRVTALTSGRGIIVRINDRGPELDKFPDRVIDLDSVAYKELAPLGTGTIAVRVELLRN